MKSRTLACICLAVSLALPLNAAHAGLLKDAVKLSLAGNKALLKAGLKGTASALKGGAKLAKASIKFNAFVAKCTIKSALGKAC